MIFSPRNVMFVLLLLGVFVTYALLGGAGVAAYTVGACMFALFALAADLR